MARSRFVKPEFFDDTLLARCSHPARLLFVATWQIADRLGVFEWDCVKLRKYVFGYEDITVAQVDAMLDELLAQGFIKHGTFKNKAYGLVVNLAKHQKFHVAEKSKHDEAFAGAIWQASSKNPVPAPTQHPASTLPESLSLFPVPLRLSLETETETETDLSHSALPNEPKGKRKRTPAEQAAAKKIKTAFHEGHLEFYGKPLKRWGAPENAHIYHLLKSSTADDLADKALAYHRWSRPEVIKAGHPFMDHHWSFSRTLSEIEADIVKPDRRRGAAQVQEREKLADTVAVDNDGVNRINALLAQRDEDERRLREQTTGSLEQATPNHANEIGQGDPQIIHHAQPAAERRSGAGILHAPSAVRERGFDLASASGGEKR